MGRDGRHARHRDRQDKNHRHTTAQSAVVFQRTVFENPEDRQRHTAALEAFKSRVVSCARCGKEIAELASALADRQTGEPVHFDCVLEMLKEQERLKENERLTYIGQGKFAVLHFENPRDTRHFTIVKTIEWEPRDAHYDWRTEMSGLYSQVL